MSKHTKQRTFTKWRRELDTLIKARAGLDTAHLSHLDLNAPFTAGESPAEYFADVVESELADLGFWVDDPEFDAPPDPDADLRSRYLAATGDFF